MSEPIIVASHLSHNYQSGALRKAALIDINLEIARGSCAAIIGVTGSGKTTLVQHFNGLLLPSDGTIVVDGQQVRAGADLRRLRQRVGMLFQFSETQLFAPSVFADVAFGPRRLQMSRREIRTRVLQALETVGLPGPEYGHRSPFELSGGQRRRVALAGVLAMAPEILVMDEPTVGLDAAGRAEFYTYLRSMQKEQGMTIVLVSHDMAEVSMLADTLFVLHKGMLVMQGKPREVFMLGAQLHKWGLAAPPLNELLSLLRERGMAIPKDVATLEDVIALFAAERRRTSGD
ncbi:energy-coupling factor transporter ATPase [Ktedonosporobacter rubrisoli]|uniref:Energy-coupling factor transporter ATPase n=1 Tax=Ktedonosporobacter rubrisoli TaxID=2509675 RepID=A0A4P6JSK3_KTERU|nr:energy-coupling factor transporter ATPase [Ktedonosporobacter rubrisoli]QBD78202.1 energy-coupling factor transporter ATPase [Ktedonosporobacter rubrisoli]